MSAPCSRDRGSYMSDPCCRYRGSNMSASLVADIEDHT